MPKIPLVMALDQTELSNRQKRFMLNFLIQLTKSDIHG